MKLDSNTLESIKELCHKHRVKTLFMFGSAVRGELKAESDIDFAVDFNESDPFIYSDLYFELKDKLTGFLKRKIDLIELRAIKNSFFRKELDETKLLIYRQ